ncbi:MAG: tRNA lysidine(34) synthetase TilS [Actinomycetaceae bacterium]|nr:tRNA lysidine(34) synthetase TilS [Actinomycetaceae bacterium]MDY5854165.1 tRNA lysidine(34) synthetase TilS [Arcanobacterium sp.]
MSRPHPLVSQARHALQAVFAQLPIGAPVLLAVSGGADSMALAASARYAARERAIELHSLTVDHGVRRESADEAHAVQRQLMELGIAARIQRVHVDGASTHGARSGSSRSSQGPEGNARVARYQALADEALRLGRERGEQAAPVLLGHNADDQAETVLLGLARGSGARSIAGMPQVGALPEHPQVPMIRPLLEMRSAQLRTVCQELGISWVEDPTNQLDGQWRAADGSPLRRSAVRHRVIPLLEEVLGEGVVPALVRTGQLLAADDAALMEAARDALAAVSLETPGRGHQLAAVRIRCAQLATYPQAVRTRSLRTAALSVGARPGELFFSHISALDKLVVGRENNIHIDLPGARATKQQGVLEIEQRRSPRAMPQS